MAEFERIPAEAERIAASVLDAAFKVHRSLGPGLLESAYETCVSFELQAMGIPHKTQVAIPIAYEGNVVEAGFRVDLLVSEIVIVELKAVDAIHPIHEAQLLTYLKLTGLRLGLLINFNVKQLRDGIKRMVR